MPIRYGTVVLFRKKKEREWKRRENEEKIESRCKPAGKSHRRHERKEAAELRMRLARKDSKYILF